MRGKIKIKKEKKKVKGFFKEFKSKGYICKNCPSLDKCTQNSKFEKTFTMHIWSDYLDKVEVNKWTRDSS